MFARRPFRPGEVVECCPVLSVSARDRALLERTRLRGYVYQRRRGAGAIALGLGSLYNHSGDPNAACELDLDHECLVITARRAIGAGDEITISYGEETDLWFTTRGDERRSTLDGAGSDRRRTSVNGER